MNFFLESFPLSDKLLPIDEKKIVLKSFFNRTISSAPPRAPKMTLYIIFKEFGGAEGNVLQLPDFNTPLCMFGTI